MKSEIAKTNLKSLKHNTTCYLLYNIVKLRGTQNLNFDNITNIENLPLNLKVSDVARVLGISKNSAYDLCHSKGFPCIRVGKRRLIIPRPAFQKWLENPTF